MKCDVDVLISLYANIHDIHLNVESPSCEVSFHGSPHLPAVTIYGHLFILSRLKCQAKYQNM
jgi:hypothetical protein